MSLHSIFKSISSFLLTVLIVGLNQPSANSQVLVLIHDTVVTTSQPKRLADKDTLFRHLPSVVTAGYQVRTFDSTSTFSDLNSFRTIIIQETSFDAPQCRYLGAAAKTQFMTWLNGGTPAAKRSLLMIGGDLGYNYDRSASAGKDTVFSRQFGGYIWLVDNGNLTSQNGVYKIVGLIKDSMTTSPAGAGFYPDDVRLTNSAAALYGYSGRGPLDSLAGVSRITANYNFVSFFADPRYFTAIGGTSPNPNIGFKRILNDLILYIVANGGSITGVNNISGEIPSRFELKQNYPNPFNPNTTIEFAIPKNSLVVLKLYDILGKEVQTLVSGDLKAGFYSAEVDGTHLASGSYFYKLISGDFVETRKMILVK